jgi:isopenicillin N synthase-like dioxygenase
LSHLKLKKEQELNLGLEEDFFSSRHQYMFYGADKNRTIFRSLYYPTLADRDIQPGVVRCGAHSDYGAITLLLQDDMGGLEVLIICSF